MRRYFVVVEPPPSQGLADCLARLKAVRVTSNGWILRVVGPATHLAAAMSDAVPIGCVATILALADDEDDWALVSN